LQSAQSALEQQVTRLTEALAHETRRREGAEQQTVEIRQRRCELEADLTRDRQAQAQLRQELETSRNQLQAQQVSAAAEQTRLETRIRELQTTIAEVEQQARRLAQTLAEETTRREGAEQQAGQISQRRNELEAQLAESKQSQSQLCHELEESRKTLEVQRKNYLSEHSKLESKTKELETVAKELAVVRSRIEQESLQCRRLAEKLIVVERAKAELAAQADTASALVVSHENAIRLLDSQVQERQEEVEKLGSLLHSEIAQRLREQLQIEALERRAAALAVQIAEKVAEQQRWRERESELEQRIRQQKDQLADSVAAASIQELELKRLKSANDDLQVIHSALCGQVRELTGQRDMASKQIHEMVAQSKSAMRTIRERDQELAVLRHSILDAARNGVKVSFERLQVDCQVVGGWKRLISTLLDTPLSMAQRGLIAEVIGALEGWRNGRAHAANGVEFQVELPDLRCCEFNCADVIERALAAVRNNAEQTGAKIQTTLVGPVPERAHGNAQYIHQLITLLTASLPEVGRLEDLELQISFESNQNDTAAMLMALVLSSTCNAETLCLRLRTITAASAKLSTPRCSGPELALSSAWQLALAMGGSPAIEAAADRKVRVQISIPLAEPLALLARPETVVDANSESAQPSDSVGVLAAPSVG
jgi:chromosome segregation ATPase